MDDHQLPRTQNSNHHAQATRVLPSRVARQNHNAAAISAVGPRTDLITNRPSRLQPQPSVAMTNPSMITTQSLSLYGNGNGNSTHFYASRGTAEHEPYDTDAVPMPQVTYMQHGYAPSMDLPKSSNRPMDDTMGILSAESYDIQSASQRAQRRLGQRQKQQARIVSPVFGLVEQGGLVEQPERMARSQAQRLRPDAENTAAERRRKKQKLSSEDEGDDDAAKKARGRPRLDTKDETAADRRRTQIRMAQRAYRHRKETTISSLEKQVQELRAANEQMSNIFVSLHDVAAGGGLLHREPEFGNHLKSTTERFLAIAKSVQPDDCVKDEEGTSMEGSKKSHSDADPETGTHSKLSQSLPLLSAPLENPPIIGASLWGYQIMEDSQDDSQNNQITWNQQEYMAPSRQDHQIISRPTLDNASFGFDFYDNNFQQYRAEIPELNDYQQLVNFQEILPLTKSLAHHETTFGRHLQRAALERGWRLINAKNPNPTRFNEVFGFCLRFETRDSIVTRLKNCLERTTKDSLFYWRHPFLHLGRAGFHYNPDENSDESVAPKFDMGMSIGPWTQSVLNTRETAMFDNYRINLPGFEGEFFDSNDVEGYLRGRGIDIPPDAEFVTVNLDLLSLQDVSSPPSLSDGNGPNSLSPVTPKSSQGRPAIFGGQRDDLPLQVDDHDLKITDNFDMGFSASIAEWSNQSLTKAFDNPFDLSFGAISMPQATMIPSTSARLGLEDHVVSLSVSVLVEELIAKTVCLGRATGFRPSDVESALRRALQRAL